MRDTTTAPAFSFILLIIFPLLSTLWESIKTKKETAIVSADGLVRHIPCLGSTRPSGAKGTS
jgi:hypothetical protein